MVTQTSLAALDDARAQVKRAGENATADQLRTYLKLVRDLEKKNEEQEKEKRISQDQKSGSSIEKERKKNPSLSLSRLKKKKIFHHHD